jgi:hypothetical protein
MTARKRVAFTGVVVLLGPALALGSAELLLRLSGRQPWRYLGVQSREPVMHDPDPQLGWLPRPGRHRVPAYSPEGQDIDFTLLADGARATGSPARNGPAAVAFVGCSLTQGWAISDEETFAWRIQERFPSLRVANYGTGAYGTYQSLLVMERLLARPDPPRLVLYGFMEEHESRNVAHPIWLRTLDLYSKGGMIATPYCTLDDSGHLVRHPPVQHPQWPLRTSLASVSLLEQRYADVAGAARAAQARPVTEQLLLEMDRLARSRGVQFGVILLRASPAAKAHYVGFLQRHRIDFVDCAVPLGRGMQVPGEGHPNGQANAVWAACIADHLRDTFGLAG